MEKNYALRHEKGAKTKEKLIEASIKLINERGYDNTSIDDICAACGTSKGAFYHHFKSKMDIVAAMEEKVSSAVAENDMPENADVFTRLMSAFMQFMTGVQESGLGLVRQRTIYNVGGKYIEEAEAGSYSVSTRKTTKKILADAIKKGELCENTPVDDIAEAISVFISGLIASWTMHSGSFDLTRRAQNLGEIVIRGLLSGYID